MLPEKLQATLVAYLERIDWTGGSERIARFVESCECPRYTIALTARRALELETTRHSLIPLLYAGMESTGQTVCEEVTDLSSADYTLNTTLID